MEQPEFLSEEEELEWHEKVLREVAKAEYRRIAERIARGRKPDIIDRILLRMARSGVLVRKTKRLKSAGRG